MYSIHRFTEVMDFPWCNKTDIDCYVRMPTDPPQTAPIVEISIEPYKKTNAILEPTFPMIISFHIEMGRYVYWISVIQCLSVRLNMQQASLGRKWDTAPPWLHRQAVAVLSKCKATMLPHKSKGILCSINTTGWSACKAIWTFHIEAGQATLKDIGEPEPWK